MLAPEAKMLAPEAKKHKLRMKNVAFLFELKPKCSQVSIPVFWLINL
jgi:hypothetical protein